MNDAKDVPASSIEADIIAESVALQRVDEAGAIARPGTVGRLHIEAEYEELEAEQAPLWAAEGLAAARPAQLVAAGAELAADIEADLTRGQQEVVADARGRYAETVAALSAYVRRPQKATIPHYATKAALFIGDGVGLIAAALWLGEELLVAVIMAVAVAAATVTAGLSGSEVKDLRGRALRRRNPEELSDAQRRYQHLFDGPDSGWRYVKTLVYVCTSVVAALAIAVATLRGIVDDPIVGIVFGAIAAAVAGASWIDSYMYADEVADAIDRERRVLDREEKMLVRRASSLTWRTRAQARVEADSLIREHEHRGHAASVHMRALLARILRNNPGVAGNGHSNEPTAIGQTPRRNGGTK